MTFSSQRVLGIDNAAILLSGEYKIRTKGNSSEDKVAALPKLLHEGYGRTETNQACVDYFREKHGVWSGL